MKTLNEITNDKYIKDKDLVDLLRGNINSDPIQLSKVLMGKNEIELNHYPVYTVNDYGLISEEEKAKPHGLLLRGNKKLQIEDEFLFFLFVYPMGYDNFKSKVNFYSIVRG